MHTTNKNIAQIQMPDRRGGLSCCPGSVSLLYGPKPIFHFSHGIAGEQLMQNRRVAVIDGANRFSPHMLASIARRHRIDPEILLDRIVISRAFTCYQMESAVADHAPEYLTRHDCSMLIVFGPLDLFYDEQAPMRDVHRGLQHMLDALAHIKAQGIAVLIASQGVQIPRGRGHLFPSLKTHADNVYRLDIGEKRFALLVEKSIAAQGTRRIAEEGKHHDRDFFRNAVECDEFRVCTVFQQEELWEEPYRPSHRSFRKRLNHGQSSGAG
jgi:hypothetical protein